MNSKPVKLPIVNRDLIIQKIIKINVFALMIPVLVLTSSWTVFNIYFAIVIYFPIMVYSYYLFQKSNISRALWVGDTIIVTHSGVDKPILISDIYDIKQMVNLYYLTNFKMQNIYQLSLKTKQSFDCPIYLEFDVQKDITTEHELITNLKNAIENMDLN